MLARTNFDAFGVSVVAMLMMVAGRVVNAVGPWTEMYIPYNNGDASLMGDDGPYDLDDPLRQYVHLLQNPLSNQPSPVFFHSHGNGGDADLTADKLDIFINAGYSVISWESVGEIENSQEIEVCWSDFDLVWDWFQANAAQLNLDPDSVVIGGRSRGSICSWPMAHSQKPAIRGLYMNGALPDPVWAEGVGDSPWLEEVTVGSPPAYLVYQPFCEKPITQDCKPTPNENDIHNPRNGQKIVGRYTELGMARMIKLTDGLENDDIGIFDLFPAFVAFLDDAIWTEMFIPYNNGDASSMGDFGPYVLDDPLRQHLHLLQTPSSNNKPSPVYFFSHGNGSYADNMSSVDLKVFINAGYSVISWESVTQLSIQDEIEVCWSDFDLVWAWFEANAVQFNFDPDSVVIGGRSRGSICSWPMAHSQKPGINGIYMYGALPDQVWIEDSPWEEDVTAGSPPAYLVYGPECDKPITQDCKPTPNENDIHNPRHGQTIVDRYTELGINSTITLTDGLINAGMEVYELFPAFAASLGDDPNPSKVHIKRTATGGKMKGQRKWKPKLVFVIVDSETNEKVKDVEFTIEMSYGKKKKTEELHFQRRREVCVQARQCTHKKTEC